ncbi:MAG TPA: hypothetical protein VMN04_05445, partial [Thermoanaerobaculia bacterium]|nr:hypothetical protein [Thermoanaerobaculia bacterium]
IGLALGQVLSVAVTRLIKAVLLGVAPTDALTFSAVAFLLSAVAAVAVLLPAVRATHVDPIVALRYE